MGNGVEMWSQQEKQEHTFSLSLSSSATILFFLCLLATW